MSKYLILALLGVIIYQQHSLYNYSQQNAKAFSQALKQLKKLQDATVKAENQTEAEKSRLNIESKELQEKLWHEIKNQECANTLVDADAAKLLRKHAASIR